ncbi:NRDE family protein [Hahella ganghwensis]|uniref:NRDE family protein n=1 Tax=Hahella ganghwensis TaxID=286420 RepID=UPI00035CCC1F|nr:NRDE family protein [Hahella ganghwensis]
MCLIFAAYNMQPDYPLIVAANRDEFYERPTQSLHRWDDQPDIYAGRDLKEGGTWMGVHREGRFAAVTNFRSGHSTPAPLSRGNLVKDLLLTSSQKNFVTATLSEKAQDYGGFNTLSYDGEALIYCSNRAPDFHRVLPPGFYGLSNGLLNAEWPKVSQGLQQFRSIIEANSLDASKDMNSLWELLANGEQAPDELLPDTGIDQHLERLLSSRFIRSPTYGTRASTILTWNKERRIKILERNFNHEGVIGEKEEIIKLLPDGKNET